MLTPAQRQRLTAEMADMKPEARLRHIAALRQRGGHAADVSVLEGIHQQLCFAEMAAATPLEINGLPPRKPSAQLNFPHDTEVYWTQKRIGYIVGAVSMTGGLIYLGVVVVIPALIALFSAVVSAITFVAPYVAGAVLAIIVIREALFGQKKTPNYQQNTTPNSGGNVYNIYVGNDQNVRIFGGGQNPGQ